MHADKQVWAEASIRISKELERKGYSKHKLETTSWIVKIREHVENSERGNQPLFNTGSNTEGTDVSGSDRDVMVGFPNVTVIQSQDSIPCLDNNHVFLMIQEGTRPCYTRLRLVREGLGKNKENDLFTSLGGKEKLCIKEDEYYFLSSRTLTERMRLSVASRTESSSAHSMSSFHVHGPCVSFDNTVGNIMFDADFAFCLPCHFFPKEADAFLSKHISNNWPQKNIINNCKRDCHLVPVGDKTSEVQTTEWRVSYALLERELVWSFNDTVCKCYVMLKMLLKQHIDHIAPYQISSYTLKTMMFWIAETEPAELWTEESLIECLVRCLSKLYSYVSAKTIPHYVVPSNNILKGKFEDSKQHTAVKEALQMMMKWHWSEFLNCKALSGLKNVWKEVKHDVKSFLRCSRHPNIGPAFYKDMVSFRALQSLYMDINSYITTPVDAGNLLQRFREICVEGHGREILDCALNALTFKLYYTQMQFLTTKNSSATHELIYQRNASHRSLTFNNMKHSSPDVCSGMIYTALRFLQERKTREAEETLERALKSYYAHVMYIGSCGPEETDIIEYGCYVVSSKSLTLTQKVQQLLTFDFVICKLDSVPPVLSKVLLLWDEDSVPICIHPRVMIYYLYFLSVIGQGKVGKGRAIVAALSMHVTMTSTKNKVWSYVAWNLLGHSFFMLGMYRHAFRAFCRSLVTKSTNNPALFYISCC